MEKSESMTSSKQADELSELIAFHEAAIENANKHYAFGSASHMAMLHRKWANLLCALRARLSSPSVPDGWTCAAHKQGSAGGNDPQECDWPTCGCDPYADKVIASLQESGLLTQPPSAPPEAGKVQDGWILAMRVLQSDLYRELDDKERAVCDALISENPYIAPPKPTAPDGG
jgi:hypothetical protein